MRSLMWMKPDSRDGWLNANGPGQPISDPLDNLAVEVHTYLDTDQGGSTTGITSVRGESQSMTQPQPARPFAASMRPAKKS